MASFFNPLKSVYHSILQQVLGRFVERFDSTDFELSIISGRAKFSNLKLRKDVLVGLDLPVEVEEGVLENLSLEVPWTLSVVMSLWQGDDLSGITMAPIKLHLQNIRVVFMPLETAQTSADGSADFRRRAAKDLEQKQQRLNTMFRDRLLNRISRWGIGAPEGVASAAAGPKPAYFWQGKDDALSERVFKLLLRFLHVRISRVHIQYKSPVDAFGTRRFILGCALNELSYSPCHRACCGEGVPVAADARSGTIASSSLASALDASINAPVVDRGLVGRDAATDRTSSELRASPSLPSTNSLLRGFQHSLLHWKGFHVYLSADYLGSNTVASSTDSVFSAAVKNTASTTSANAPDAGTDARISESDSHSVVSEVDGSLPPQPIRPDLHAPGHHAQLKPLPPGSLLRALGWARQHVPLESTQLCLHDMSGTASIVRQDAGVVREAEDPPAFTTHVHVFSVDFRVSERQFAYLRAVFSYVQQVDRHARYKNVQRPLARGRKVLTAAQSIRLRDWMAHRSKLVHRQKLLESLNASTSMTTNTMAGENVIRPAAVSATGVREVATVATVALGEGIRVPSKKVKHQVISALLAPLPPLPPDPYEDISPRIRTDVSCRARRWWRFMLDCFRLDVRRHLRKDDTSEFVSTDVLRNEYIRLCKLAWAKSWGFLVVPPVTLPSFSVIVERQKVSGAALVTIPSPISDVANPLAAHSPSFQWLCDVAPAFVSPRAIVIRDAERMPSPSILAAQELKLKAIEASSSLDALLSWREMAESEFIMEHLLLLQSQRQSQAIQKLNHFAHGGLSAVLAAREGCFNVLCNALATPELSGGSLSIGPIASGHEDVASAKPILEILDPLRAVMALHVCTSSTEAGSANSSDLSLFSDLTPPSGSATNFDLAPYHELDTAKETEDATRLSLHVCSTDFGGFLLLREISTRSVGIDSSTAASVSSRKDDSGGEAVSTTENSDKNFQAARARGLKLLGSVPNPALRALPLSVQLLQAFASRALGGSVSISPPAMCSTAPCTQSRAEVLGCWTPSMRAALSDVPTSSAIFASRETDVGLPPGYVSNVTAVHVGFMSASFTSSAGAPIVSFQCIEVAVNTRRIVPSVRHIMCSAERVNVLHASAPFVVSEPFPPQPHVAGTETDAPSWPSRSSSAHVLQLIPTVLHCGSKNSAETLRLAYFPESEPIFAQASLLPMPLLLRSPFPWHRDRSGSSFHRRQSNLQHLIRCVPSLQRLLRDELSFRALFNHACSLLSGSFLTMWRLAAAYERAADILSIPRQQLLSQVSTATVVLGGTGSQNATVSKIAVGTGSKSAISEATTAAVAWQRVSNAGSNSDAICPPSSLTLKLRAQLLADVAVHIRPFSEQLLTEGGNSVEALVISKTVANNVLAACAALPLLFDSSGNAIISNSSKKRGVLPSWLQSSTGIGGPVLSAGDVLVSSLLQPLRQSIQEVMLGDSAPSVRRSRDESRPSTSLDPPPSSKAVASAEPMQRAGFSLDTFLWSNSGWCARHCCLRQTCLALERQDACPTLSEVSALCRSLIDEKEAQHSEKSSGRETVDRTANTSSTGPRRHMKSAHTGHHATRHLSVEHKPPESTSTSSVSANRTLRFDACHVLMVTAVWSNPIVLPLLNTTSQTHLDEVLRREFVSFRDTEHARTSPWQLPGECVRTAGLGIASASVRHPSWWKQSHPPWLHEMRQSDASPRDSSPYHSVPGPRCIDGGDKSYFIADGISTPLLFKRGALVLLVAGRGPVSTALSQQGVVGFSTFSGASTLRGASEKERESSVQWGRQLFHGSFDAISGLTLLSATARSVWMSHGTVASKELSAFKWGGVPHRASALSWLPIFGDIPVDGLELRFHPLFGELAASHPSFVHIPHSARSAVESSPSVSLPLLPPLVVVTGADLTTDELLLMLFPTTPPDATSMAAAAASLSPGELQLIHACSLFICTSPASVLHPPSSESSLNLVTTGVVQDLLLHRQTTTTLLADTVSNRVQWFRVISSVLVRNRLALRDAVTRQAVVTSTPAGQRRADFPGLWVDFDMAMVNSCVYPQLVFRLGAFFTRAQSAMLQQASTRPSWATAAGWRPISYPQEIAASASRLQRRYTRGNIATLEMYRLKFTRLSPFIHVRFRGVRLLAPLLLPPRNRQNSTGVELKSVDYCASPQFPGDTSNSRLTCFVIALNDISARSCVEGRNMEERSALSADELVKWCQPDSYNEVPDGKDFMQVLCELASASADVVQWAMPASKSGAIQSVAFGDVPVAAIDDFVTFPRVSQRPLLFVNSTTASVLFRHQGVLNAYDVGEADFAIDPSIKPLPVRVLLVKPSEITATLPIALAPSFIAFSSSWKNGVLNGSASLQGSVRVTETSQSAIYSLPSGVIPQTTLIGIVIPRILASICTKTAAGVCTALISASLDKSSIIISRDDFSHAVDPESLPEMHEVVNAGSSLANGGLFYDAGTSLATETVSVPMPEKSSSPNRNVETIAVNKITISFSLTRADVILSGLEQTTTMPQCNLAVITPLSQNSIHSAIHGWMQQPTSNDACNVPGNPSIVAPQIQRDLHVSLGKLILRPHLAYLFVFSKLVGPIRSALKLSQDATALWTYGVSSDMTEPVRNTAQVVPSSEYAESGTSVHANDDRKPYAALEAWCQNSLIQRVPLAPEASTFSALPNSLEESHVQSSVAHARTIARLDSCHLPIEHWSQRLICHLRLPIEQNFLTQPLPLSSAVQPLLSSLPELRATDSIFSRIQSALHRLSLNIGAIDGVLLYDGSDSKEGDSYTHRTAVLSSVIADGVQFSVIYETVPQLPSSLNSFARLANFAPMECRETGRRLAKVDAGTSVYNDGVIEPSVRVGKDGAPKNSRWMVSNEFGAFSVRSVRLVGVGSNVEEASSSSHPVGDAWWSGVCGGVLQLEMRGLCGIFPRCTLSNFQEPPLLDTKSAISNGSLPRRMQLTADSISLTVEPDPFILPAWARSRFYGGDSSANPGSKDGDPQTTAPPLHWKWVPGALAHSHLLRDIVRLDAVAHAAPSNVKNYSSISERRAAPLTAALYQASDIFSRYATGGATTILDIAAGGLRMELDPLSVATVAEFSRRAIDVVSISRSLSSGMSIAVFSVAVAPSASISVDDSPSILRNGSTSGVDATETVARDALGAWTRVAIRPQSAVITTFVLANGYLRDPASGPVSPVWFAHTAQHGISVPHTEALATSAFISYEHAEVLRPSSSSVRTTSRMYLSSAHISAYEVTPTPDDTLATALPRVAPLLARTNALWRRVCGPATVLPSPWPAPAITPLADMRGSCALLDPVLQMRVWHLLKLRRVLLATQLWTRGAMTTAQPAVDNVSPLSIAAPRTAVSSAPRRGIGSKAGGPALPAPFSVTEQQSHCTADGASDSEKRVWAILDEDNCTSTNLKHRDVVRASRWIDLLQDSVPFSVDNTPSYPVISDPTRPYRAIILPSFPIWDPRPRPQPQFLHYQVAGPGVSVPTAAGPPTTSAQSFSSPSPTIGMHSSLGSSVLYFLRYANPRTILYIPWLQRLLLQTAEAIAAVEISSAIPESIDPVSTSQLPPPLTAVMQTLVSDDADSDADSTSSSDSDADEAAKVAEVAPLLLTSDASKSEGAISKEEVSQAENRSKGIPSAAVDPASQQTMQLPAPSFFFCMLMPSRTLLTQHPSTPIATTTSGSPPVRTTAADAKEAYLLYAAEAAAADCKPGSAIQPPRPQPVDLGVSGFMQIFIRDASVVYFKRFVEETKVISALIKVALEPGIRADTERLWACSSALRNAAFDYMHVLAERVKVVLPPSSTCTPVTFTSPTCALVATVRRALVKNALVHLPASMPSEAVWSDEYLADIVDAIREPERLRALFTYMAGHPARTISVPAAFNALGIASSAADIQRLASPPPDVGGARLPRSLVVSPAMLARANLVGQGPLSPAALTMRPGMQGTSKRPAPQPHGSGASADLGAIADLLKREQLALAGRTGPAARPEMQSLSSPVPARAVAESKVEATAESVAQPLVRAAVTHILAPLERQIVELEGVDAWILEPTPNTVAAGRSSDTPGVSSLPMHAIDCSDPRDAGFRSVLSALVEMQAAVSLLQDSFGTNEGLAPSNRIREGVTIHERLRLPQMNSPTLLEPCPRLSTSRTLLAPLFAPTTSRRMFTSERLHTTIDSPFGAVFRLLCAVQLNAFVGFSGMFDVSSALAHVNLLQDVLKFNAKEPSTAVHLPPELLGETAMSIHAGLGQAHARPAGAMEAFVANASPVAGNRQSMFTSPPAVAGQPRRVGVGLSRAAPVEAGLASDRHPQPGASAQITLPPQFVVRATDAFAAGVVPKFCTRPYLCDGGAWQPFGILGRPPVPPLVAALILSMESAAAAGLVEPPVNANDDLPHAAPVIPSPFTAVPPQASMPFIYSGSSSASSSSPLSRAEGARIRNLMLALTNACDDFDAGARLGGLTLAASTSTWLPRPVAPLGDRPHSSSVEKGVSIGSMAAALEATVANLSGSVAQGGAAAIADPHRALSSLLECQGALQLLSILPKVPEMFEVLDRRGDEASVMFEAIADASAQSPKAFGSNAASVVSSGHIKRRSVRFATSSPESAVDAARLTTAENEHQPPPPPNGFGVHAAALFMSQLPRYASTLSSAVKAAFDELHAAVSASARREGQRDRVADSLLDVAEAYQRRVRELEDRLSGALAREEELREALVEQEHRVREAQRIAVDHHDATGGPPRVHWKPEATSSHLDTPLRNLSKDPPDSAVRSSVASSAAMQPAVAVQRTVLMLLQQIEGVRAVDAFGRLSVLGLLLAIAVAMALTWLAVLAF